MAGFAPLLEFVFEALFEPELPDEPELCDCDDDSDVPVSVGDLGPGCS